MSFNFYLYRGFRLLLFPFSFVVGVYIFCRNYCFDKGWLPSASFGLPVICIGNLSTGGTGKSPMTEYLLALLMPNYKVATLSRGYRRKTKGYILANETVSALDIGDEPMQFHQKFPQVAVAVGESRLEAIGQLLQDCPATQVVILDDAFQHRPVTAGCNILLTEFGNPYWWDWYLPTGDLRDSPASAVRAQIIIVTKCPLDMSVAQKNQYIRHIRPLANQKVFFSSIEYGIPYHIVTKRATALTPSSELLLICGIANPLPLKKYIESRTASYLQKTYKDHHIFNIDDWQEINALFHKMDAAEKIMLTTEKDAMRLLKFGKLLNDVPLYVLPIKHHFLFEEAALLDISIINFVESFYQPTT